MPTTTPTDPRVRRLSILLERAAELDALAERGGDALVTAETYQERAARCLAQARWIESKIQQFPFGENR